ncbi:cyclase family protein [Rhodobacterales bacterium HKCCE2091]|nr:cyclase family protein [Rhodobacterales bacterium HKCCE2091]
MNTPDDLDLWKAASATVREGRILDLGRVFHTGMPHYPTHPDFEIGLFRRHGERVRGDGASSASCHWAFGGHTGTHIDALCHVSQDRRMFDGGPADNDAIEAGTASGDAAAFPAYLRRGILFDVAKLHGTACLPPDRVVTIEDLAAAGPEPQPGDVALIRTGWGTLWGQETYIGHETPGPDLDAGTWLADRGVALVGSDTAVFEKGPVTDAAPVHRLMLIERRIPIMENLDLEALSTSGATDFLFAALPLRARGATASPLRPVAVI